MTHQADLIGLIGAECTGKSTLAQELSKELPAHVVDEVLRDFVDTHGRTPRQDEQASILLAQQQAALSALEAVSDQTIVVVDSPPIMTAVYSMAYFNDDALVGAACADIAQYRLVAWCRPDFDWNPDGLHRDGDDMRDTVDRLLAEQIVPLLRDRTNVIEVTGTVHERACLVRQAWQRSQGSAPT